MSPAWFSSHGHCLKTIEIHGVTLDLPEDHWLPKIRKKLPEYSENIGRLAAVVEAKYPHRGFIDVGAGVGDTAAIVCAHSRLPILCVEGSQYREILQENVRRLRADVELECATDDGPHCLTTESSILAGHASFQSSKLLKIVGRGMYERLLESALEWMASARPILYWKHGLGHDAGSSSGNDFAIFDRLSALGYRTGLVFDPAGEFLQTISLDAHRQFADIGDYFARGAQLHQCGDLCAFQDEDIDLCERFRQVEMENRRMRGSTALPMHFEGTQDPELAWVRAHTELDRQRLHREIAELETHIALKDREIDRLHGVLRDLLRSEDLKAQLKDLRQELDSSLALRAARSLHWILGPIRKRMTKGRNGDHP